VIAVQESLPSEELAIATSSLTLLMLSRECDRDICRPDPYSEAVYQAPWRNIAPFVDPEVAIDTGATEIRQLVTPDQLPELLRAYNEALTQIFVSCRDW
jgi:hypothetical protein